MRKLNEPKEKAKKAFKEGKFDEAITFYSEAIKLSKPYQGKLTQESCELAALFSDRAQVHIKQKNYKLALKDINKSLKINPVSKKGLIRRASIYIELKRDDEAVLDMRNLFQYDPLNVTARIMMRKVKEPVKMNKHLYEAYTDNVLRNGLTEICGCPKSCLDNCGFKFILLRQMFVSKNGRNALWGRINGSKITHHIESDQALWIFSHWFTVIRRKNDLSSMYTSILLSRRTFSTILDLFQPKDLEFIVTSKCFVKTFGTLYNYSRISHFMDIAYTYLEPKSREIRAITTHCNFLKRLPYFDGIKKLKNNKFSNVNCLLVPAPATVDDDFLEWWMKKSEWRIETVIFAGSPPDLTYFEKFDTEISKHVTKLFLPVDDELDGFCGFAEGKQFCDNMSVLSISFPNLTSITGTFDWTFSVERFSTFLESSTLKRFISHLATAFIQHFRLKDRNAFKFSFNFNVVMTRKRLRLFNWKSFRQSVEKCRNEVKNLKSLSCHGSSTKTLNWNSAACYFAAIEMETKCRTKFQITFTHIPEEISSIDI